MRHIFKKNNGEEHNFWMSYTDLMSGFLIIFMLASIYMFNRYELEAEKFERVSQELNIKNPDSLMVVIYELTSVVDSIKASNLKNQIERYKNVFPSTDEIEVEFNTVRGSIILKHQNPEEELFESGKPYLYREKTGEALPLKPYLDQIYVALVDTTMAIAKTHKNVEIRIEGHTDPSWGTERGTKESYLKNLDLSSRRANTVYEYILNGEHLNDEQREFIMKHMISVGYSFSERLEENEKSDGSIYDRSIDPASRRIEFRIISK